MTTPPAPTAEKARPEPKPTNITITVKVTYPAKANMTLADFVTEGEKAKKLAEQAKALGTVTGEVTIGKQTFPL